MRPVVTVGLRPGALDAAERLGRPVVAVVEKPPGPKTAARLAGVVEAEFGAPPDRWRRVADDLRALDPAAVVALTERSVVPAARLRHALGMGGLTVEAAVRCSDKRAMKRAARAAGLACADVVEADDGLTGAEVVERLGLPLVLKTAVGSGGRGTRIVVDPADVPGRLAPGEMAESFVDGVEMSVETFVIDGETVFANPTAYLAPGWASLVPAPLAPDVRDAVLAHAEAARRALGVTSGMTHLEAFLTPDGPVFGELAARPPGGHLMPLLGLAYGVDPWEAVLRVALGETPELPTRADRVAAARILHPGPGTVRAVEGVEAARAMPGVEAVSVRVRAGVEVGPREGTGQEAGHVIVTGATAAQAEARLAAAAAAVRIEVA
ncbi:ATP-grasp domain-containing protein [Rubrivirga sp.]|uniref:ATP-grasp domain-containing protein n=1 Tax=Rubrivirga sp. TaxID=1885344 RepID=UPI003B516B28